jgi:drug/metabolite transporter (DMT)-like permease
MVNRLISILALLVAAIGWSSLIVLANQAHADQPGALPFFFALLFLAVFGTLAPAAAFLNRRFAAEATANDPWRFFRHSAWGGLCVTVCAWLQMHRIFNIGFALVIALMFVAVEILIVRLRAQS